MIRTMLVTRPYHDETTHYLYHWSSLTFETARKQKINVIQLNKDRASRSLLESIIEKTDPVLIFLNGHGNADQVTGHDLEVLLDVGNNEGLLRYRITYALSCSSAKNLGPKSILAGAKSYIGYDEDFIFYYDVNSISKPLFDKTASLFLEPSTMIVNMLLKGHTTSEAHIRSKAMFLQNIQNLLNSSSAEAYLIPWLLWDMQHQVCLGDQAAHI